VKEYATAAAGDLRVLGGHGGPDTVAHLAVVDTPNRGDLADRLHAAGIASDVHYPVPDHRQPGYEGDALELPVTRQAAQRVLTLPCFPEMTDEEVARVQRVLAG
jgi:dTDP-4-amino-4,6-dideoxygalactose transaminase